MAAWGKSQSVHVSQPKTTSQAGRKRSCKMSSMNKHKKRRHKFYRGQGR